MSSQMDVEVMMNSEELLVASYNNDPTNIAKGKRTKRRLRPLSPCVVATVTTTTTTTAITAAMTSSCSSASGGGGTSLSSTTFEEEEEDMANCLILLAQGRGGGDPNHHKELCGEVKREKGSTKNIDFFVYECKTCNRTFPSFQALGGHRASHKKPKLEEKKLSPASSPPFSLLPPPPVSSHLLNFEEAKQSDMKIVSPSVSLQLGCGNNRGGLNFHGNKSKIHECSICGAEFTSGQALGGHMRRHRASTNNNIIVNNNNIAQTTANSDDAVQVKARNILELDLNLPAPEDDLRDSKFQFPANKNSMMLSAAPALVGCHY